MSNKCIKCNREIEKPQKTCLVCGSSQNYFSHYFTTVVVFLVLLGGLAAAGYWYENRPEKTVELQRLRNIEMKARISLAEVENLTKKNLLLSVQIQEVQSQIKTANESASLNNQSEAEINKQLKKQTARAVKAEKRASWLSKQNTDFKTEINSLNEQILALQAAPDAQPEDLITARKSESNEPAPVPEKSEQEQSMELATDTDKN